MTTIHERRSSELIGPTEDRVTALVGLTAVVFSALYFLSDVIELIDGGFSTPQLALTYAAEAAIPIFVLGLYVVQRPRIGWLGLIASVTYAYTFIVFTATVVYALVRHTADWKTLQDELGGWLTVHSVLMILAGLMLGAAVVRADVLPRWTGTTLAVGMVLMAITSGMPAALGTVSAGVRDVAFAGMGVSLIRGRTRSRSRRAESNMSPIAPATGRHRVAS